MLDKKIKKHLYGKPQTIQAIFPPGLGHIAYQEVESILKTLWFPQKYVSELSLSTNEIRINNIHMSAITELLIRSQCLTDIRLIIFEGKASGKALFSKKCSQINWDFFLDKNSMLKIKVDSIASKAFHETGLKNILQDILKEYNKGNEVKYLYVNLYKNYLTISISLAGESLYKRGYRKKLSASAPLREDAAACFIKKSLNSFFPDTLLIPFSGTGTFLFEYLIHYFHFSPGLFHRDYTLQHMPLFNPENFHFLLKKAKEYCQFSSDSLTVYCMDNSDNANLALHDNLKIFQTACPIPTKLTLEKNDFFKLDVRKISGNVFMPLNPPYGIRLRKPFDYKKIAFKINEISSHLSKQGKGLSGFILCPSKESWSSFFKNLKEAKKETYHFTQGGIDVRVCQFLIDNNSKSSTSTL